MKKHRIWSLLLLCCFLMGLLLTTASAYVAEPVEAAFDGYLIRIKDEYQTVQLFGLPDGVEAVYPEIGLYRVDSLDQVSSFAAADAIAYVEPDYHVTLFDAPDDPRYGEQWSLQMIGAENAWDWGLDGAGVKIGVVDSGVNADHEDLAGARIVEGYNAIDGTTDTTDEVGHGTFVTGVIAAQTGNGLGIAGLSSGVELMPLKFFAPGHEQVSDAITAIAKGIEADCDIINMSFGIKSPVQALEDTLDQATKAGVILVAAVGNSGNSTLYYPAAYDNVIGVGSVGSGKIISSFSQKNSSVYIVAPGGTMLGLSKDGTYLSNAGTSFSCPMVVAAAALLKQADPALTAEEFASLLAASAEDLGDEGYDTTYGYGLLQLPALLEKLAEQHPLQISQEGENLVIQGGDKNLQPDTHIFAALYGDNGRLLSCKEIPNERLLHTTLTLPSNATSCRLFFLDGATLCPVRQPVLWERS